jgi:large subunit ribosomal protein L4
MGVDNFTNNELLPDKFVSPGCTYKLPAFQLGTDSSNVQNSFVDINFSFAPNRFILHRAFCVERLNNYLRTASTKTRAQVRGGGKKPWKQKGTGRARAGSSSSPLWRSGGVSFGPQPRVAYKKINRKEQLLALKTLFFNAVNKTSLLTLDESALTSNLDLGKTKNIVKLLQNIGVKVSSNEKVLIIGGKTMQSLLEVGTSNLLNVNFVTASNLSLWDILWADFLVVEKDFYFSLFI